MASMVAIIAKKVRYLNNAVTIRLKSFFVPEKKQVLKGVSGKFKNGELTAIMGPSGAGEFDNLTCSAR